MLIARRIVEPVLAAILLVSHWAHGQPATAGQWRFDAGQGGIATDSSGNHNDGEIVRAQWVACRAGKCLRFRDYAADPNPDPKDATFVRIKHSPTLVPRKGFDISATLNIDPAFTPRFTAAIVQKGDGYGCAYRLLLLEDFRVRVAAGNGHAVLESKEKLSPGTWHALRASYSAGKLTLWIDGKEEVSEAMAIQSFTNTDNLYIGARFTGLIEQVKLVMD